MKRFIALAVVCFSLFSQELTTPVYTHAPLLLNLLKQDVTIIAQNTKVYNIALIYTEEEDDSVENMNLIKKYIEAEQGNLEIEGIRVAVFPHLYKNKSALFAKMDNQKINLMYVCEEMDEKEIRKIKFVSENLGILTFTGSEDLYEEGISTTVKIENDLPKVIVNRSQLAKERAGFNLTYSLF